MACVSLLHEPVEHTVVALSVCTVVCIRAAVLLTLLSMGLVLRTPIGCGPLLATPLMCQCGGHGR